MQTQPSRRLGRRFQVRFRPVGKRESHIGYTADVSETGMFVATIRPLAPGTELDLEITDKKHCLHLDAVVVHSRKVPLKWQKLRPSGMGVRFLEPAETVVGLKQLLGPAAALWKS